MSAANEKPKKVSKAAIRGSSSASDAPSTGAASMAVDAVTAEAKAQPPHDPRGDDEYFKSYSWLGIHEEMIKDDERTGTYQDAIMNNPQHFKDKVVLDVGCGTSILSLFCADAGARKVYAVDASDMADYARQIVAKNNKSHIIEVIKGKMEEIELPEKVDVIVSEWMGYFLVYESMLDSVIFARDRWLKPGGMMYPSHARIYIAPFTFPEYYDEHIHFWKKVYGKDFSPLIELAKKNSLAEPQIDALTAEHDLSLKPILIKSIDCLTVTTKELEQWSAPFDFASTIFAEHNGFAAWFDTDFCGRSDPVPSGSSSSSQPVPQPTGRRFVLSTAPNVPATHWGQTLFYWDDPVEVKQDDRLTGEIKVSVNDKNKRFIDVELSCTWTPVDAPHKAKQMNKKFILQ